VKEHRCHNCEKSFNSADALAMHNKSKHPEVYKKPLFSSKQIMKQNKKIILAGVIILFIAVTGLIVFNNSSESNTGNKVNDGVTLFKSPNCGCCLGYASYIEQNGIEVNTEDVQDLSSVKQQQGVPYDMNACHTMLIEGYVIEGHVPMEAINKLLEEKPDIKGLSLPGMPQGSPGMTGIKRGQFTIYAISHDGTYEEFMKI